MTTGRINQVSSISCSVSATADPNEEAAAESLADPNPLQTATSMYFRHAALIRRCLSPAVAPERRFDVPCFPADIAHTPCEPCAAVVAGSSFRANG